MAKIPDLDVEQFVAALQGAEPVKLRLLGIDLGTKTIGLAISDSGWSIASPVTTIKRRKFSSDAAELLDYAERENVGGLVMGLPLNMDGSEGPRAQATRAFVRNLLAMTDLPVLYWDERLTTHAADEAMLEANMSRKKRAKNVDRIAASIILQGCLDRLRTQQIPG